MTENNNGLNNQTDSQNIDNENIVYTYSDTEIEKPVKKSKKPIRFISLVVLLVFLGGIIFGTGYISALYLGDNIITDYLNISKNSTEIPVVQKIAASQQNVSAPVAISEAVAPSVVTITSTIQNRVRTPYGYSDYLYGGGEGTGSGIIFKKDNTNLYVVTNQHVIENASKVEISLLNTETYEASVLGYDSTMDIAVLSLPLKSIDNKVLSQIAIASFGDSDKLKAGELAVAIGSPLGKEFNNTITVGVISAVNRALTINNVDLKLIQTDAAINPGNSGGALANSQGQVIGINTAKYIDTDVEGMGFAIPINTASPIIEKILNSKSGEDVASAVSSERPFLGVGVSDITEEIYLETGVPFGVYVTKVYENSGAEKGGVKEGDIIFNINDEKLKSSNDLINYVSTLKAGDTVKLGVVREGKMIELKAKLLKYNEIIKE